MEAANSGIDLEAQCLSDIVNLTNGTGGLSRGRCRSKRDATQENSLTNTTHNSNQGKRTFVPYSDQLQCKQRYRPDPVEVKLLVSETSLASKRANVSSSRGVMPAYLKVGLRSKPKVAVDLPRGTRNSDQIDLARDDQKDVSRPIGRSKRSKVGQHRGVNKVNSNWIAVDEFQSSSVLHNRELDKRLICAAGRHESPSSRGKLTNTKPDLLEGAGEKECGARKTLRCISSQEFHHPRRYRAPRRQRNDNCTSSDLYDSELGIISTSSLSGSSSPASLASLRECEQAGSRNGWQLLKKSLDELKMAANKRESRKKAIATYFKESLYFKRPTWQTDLTGSDVSAYASSSSSSLNHWQQPADDDVFEADASHRQKRRERSLADELHDVDLKLLEDLSGFGSRVVKFSSTDEESGSKAPARQVARKSIPRLELARQSKVLPSSHSLDLQTETRAAISDLISLKGCQASNHEFGASLGAAVAFDVLEKVNGTSTFEPEQKRVSRKPRFASRPISSSSGLSFSFNATTSNTSTSASLSKSCTNRTAYSYSADNFDAASVNSRVKLTGTRVVAAKRRHNCQHSSLRQQAEQNLAPILIGAYILISLSIIVILMLPYLRQQESRSKITSTETQTDDNVTLATISTMTSKMQLNEAERVAHLQSNLLEQQQQQQQNYWVASPKNDAPQLPIKQKFAQQAASESDTQVTRKRLEQQDLMKRKRILARINQMRKDAKVRESEDFQELWRVVHKRQCVPLKIPFCARSLKSMLPEGIGLATELADVNAASQLMSYDRTLLPNQFTLARQSQVERVLEKYDPLVDVRCYALMPLFLCSIFAPKCVHINATIWSQHQQPGAPVANQTNAAPDLEMYADYLDHLFPSKVRTSAIANSNSSNNGASMINSTNKTSEKIQLARLVPPCRSVCREALRKCTFFLQVLSLQLFTPDDCENLPESSDENVCVGQREHIAVEKAHANMRCRDTEFRCNNGDCIPERWHCDGFTDCSDRSDEELCSKCDTASQFYCGHDLCISKRQVCDGRPDCRDGRDERLCLRLAADSTHLANSNKSHLRRLEAWNASLASWQPVCGSHWQPMPMSHEACQALGYSRANETLILFDSPTLNGNGAGSTIHETRNRRSPPILDHPVSYEEQQQAETEEHESRGTHTAAALKSTKLHLGESHDDLRRVLQERLQSAKPAADRVKSLTGLLKRGTQFGCEPLPEDQLLSTVHLSCHGFQCGRSITSYLTRVRDQQIMAAEPPMISSVAITTSGIKSSSVSRSLIDKEPGLNSETFLEFHHWQFDGNSIEDDHPHRHQDDDDDEEDQFQGGEAQLEMENENDAEDKKKEAEEEVNSLLDTRSNHSLELSAPRTPVSARLVVGGVESMPGEFPYLAALHGGPDEVFFCGGVLISANWLLTAAHCVGNRTQPEGWMVKVGVTRRIASPAFVRKLKVRRIIKHKEFNIGAHLNNDIALIQLAEQVEFNQYLRPICLPQNDLRLGPDNSRDCVVVGFGKSHFSQEANYLHVAHFAKVPIISQKQCSIWYAEQDVRLSEGMLCAGYSEGKHDACQGDSGSGLFCRYPNTNQFYVAGLVSFGIKCATPKLPGVYTSVPYYADWINRITSGQASVVAEVL